MSNDKLKQEIEALKKAKKEKEEKVKLEKELRALKEETRKKTTTEKVLKGIGKGVIGFGKVSNKFFENQYKKNSKTKK